MVPLHAGGRYAGTRRATPLMLYIIWRLLWQVESRAVGGDVCALRDVMVEWVAGYEWRTSSKSSDEMSLEERKFKRVFSTDPIAPACHPARRATSSAPTAGWSIWS